MEESLILQFKRLGFIPSNFGMQTRIGEVEIHATEHPLKGVALFFTCVGARTATQFEGFFPKDYTAEQIAGFINVNFRANLKAHLDECKQYFESLGITLEVK